MRSGNLPTKEKEKVSYSTARKEVGESVIKENVDLNALSREFWKNVSEKSIDKITSVLKKRVERAMVSAKEINKAFGGKSIKKEGIIKEDKKDDEEDKKKKEELPQEPEKNKPEDKPILKKEPTPDAPLGQNKEKGGTLDKQPPEEIPPEEPSPGSKKEPAPEPTPEQKPEPEKEPKKEKPKLINYIVLVKLDKTGKFNGIVSVKTNAIDARNKQEEMEKEGFFIKPFTVTESNRKNALAKVIREILNKGK